MHASARIADCSGSSSTPGCRSRTARWPGLRRLRNCSPLAPAASPCWCRNPPRVPTLMMGCDRSPESAPRGLQRAFRTRTTSIGVGHRPEPTFIDRFTTERAGGVATLRETAQCGLEQAQLGPCGLGDCPENIVVLALRRLLGEVGTQGIGFMAQIGARLARPMAQLLAPAEQTLSDRFDIHVALPPGRRPDSGLRR